MTAYITDTHALLWYLGGSPLLGAAAQSAFDQAAAGFRFTSLTPQTALRIQPLTVLPDIHDRLIVAEALESGATLITRDEVITASGLVPVVW